jgi:lambda family phage portal protein
MSHQAVANNGGAMLTSGTSAYASVGNRRPRALKNALFSYNGPNSEIVYDLRELRAVCRDLYYNNADARTVVETYVDFSIGRGQRAQSIPKRSVLIPKLIERGLTQEQAETLISNFSAQAREDFDAWARSKKSTASRTMNYYSQSRLTIRTECHSGEVFAILNREKQADGSIELNVGLIEPDRVMDWRPPTERNVMGLELDERGRPVRIKVRRSGDNINDRRLDPVDFVSPVSGRVRVIHMFQAIRPGQVRGVPIYAQNIQTFTQLGRLKRNELHAGELNSYFAATVESPDPQFLQDLTDEQREKYMLSLTQGNADDLNMESGAVTRLLPGEKLNPVDPKRPNVQYGQFAKDLRAENAFSNGIPYEIYTRQFGSSYTASRAAMNMFKKPVGAYADRYETDLNGPVFVEWLYCRVASGKYSLPGFFGDPEMQAAWSNVTFTREPLGNIDDERDANAADKRIKIGLSSIEQESLEITGNDYVETMEAMKRERDIRSALGISLLFDSGQAASIEVDPKPEAEAAKLEAETAAIESQTQGGSDAQDENTV